MWIMLLLLDHTRRWVGTVISLNNNMFMFMV